LNQNHSKKSETNSNNGTTGWGNSNRAMNPSCPDGISVLLPLIYSTPYFCDYSAASKHKTEVLRRDISRAYTRE